VAAVEQVHAPVDRAGHGSLALREVSGTPPQLHPSNELIAQQRQRDGADTGCRELDRERHAVEMSADLLHDRQRCRRGREVGARRAGSLQEQLRGRRRGGRGPGGRGLGLDRQRVEPVDLLAPDMEGHARGHDQAGPLGSGRQRGHDRAGCHDVLESVEHQQRLTAREGAAHQVLGAPVSRAPPGERGEHRGRDHLDIDDRGDVHEPATVGKALRLRLRERKCESGLAHAAGSSNRQDPGCAHQAAELGQLRVPPHERGERLGEAGRRARRGN
jgi:hypothetical protein